MYIFKQVFRIVILSESQAGLQNSLNKLEKYCYKWQLTVNTNKTKIKIFQGSNHDNSTGTCKNSDKYFFKEKNAFSPFLESSWADLLNLPLLSIMFPRKLYSLTSARVD
jgi:hypothetical protein